MRQLVDSHAHLDMLDDPDTVIDKAGETGVGRILAVGIDIRSSRAAVDFALRHAGVAAAVGIHPHEAASLDDEALEQLERLVASDAVVAVGETGLDYYRGRSPREAQQRAFVQQMELARRSGKTLVVHSREAARDTLDLLQRHADGLTVVLHCFSLSEYLDECVESGYYMSIAGNVTFRNAVDLQKAATAIPGRLLLTETDSPFLAPVPHRGEENRPGNVGLVLEFLARLRGAGASQLARTIAENYGRVFKGSIV